MELIEGFNEKFDYESRRFSNVTFTHEYMISAPKPQGWFKGKKRKKAEKKMDKMYEMLLQYQRDPDGYGAPPSLLHSTHAAVNVEKKNGGIRVAVWSVADITDAFENGKADWPTQYHFLTSKVSKDEKMMNKIYSIRDQFLRGVDSIDSVVKSTAKTNSLNLEENKTIRYWSFWKNVD